MDCPKGLKVTKRKDCKAACCALGIPFGIRSEDFKHSRQCYSLDKTCVQERDKNSKAICKIGTHIYTYYTYKVSLRVPLKVLLLQYYLTES